LRVLTDASGWFTLEVPEGWEAATEDSVTTLRSPTGTSSVFFSAARHAKGQQESFGGADFLLRFLAWLGLEVEPERIQCLRGDGCRIYAFDREEGGSRWRYWSVTDDETALLIGFTAVRPPRVDAVGEEEQVETMVHSVRLYHSRPH
jgi:hypothetical protein